MANIHHAIDYVELGAPELEATRAFYESAFGWRFSDYGPDYAGIQGDGKEAGGLRRDPDARPGGAPLVIL